MCGGNNNPPRSIPKPVTITLTVANAQALYEADPQPTTQLELDAYCNLADNNSGQIPPGQTTINNFLSQVYSGNTVTWVGASGSPGYRVLINSITNNPNFFDVEPHGSSGNVTATLKTGIDGVEDTYTIGFSIDAPGNPVDNPPKSYGLDPKLRGNN